MRDSAERKSQRMGTPCKSPRLLTAKQVKLFFGIPIHTVYALRDQGKLRTEWKDGREKILRESVYEFFDRSKTRDPTRPGHGH
jgi:hypothetical protein